MQKCFVIQPFDRKYNKRYTDVYMPAISNAGLEPYRVDQDPSVDVPIDAIENGIRESSVCLADISTNNPNVWYELGYAFAAKKQIVMICSEERQPRKYPFDIQHRTVIPYSVDSSQDFLDLQLAITQRIKAILEKNAALSSVSSRDNIAPVEGLTQPELAVIAAASASVTIPGDRVPVYGVKNDVENTGFTGLAFALGVKRLSEKGFLVCNDAEDYNGHEYSEFLLTDEAWSWIENNESKFVIQHTKPTIDDSIPF